VTKYKRSKGKLRHLNIIAQAEQRKKMRNRYLGTIFSKNGALYVGVNMIGTQENKGPLHPWGYSTR